MPSQSRGPTIIVSANSLWNIANFRAGLLAELRRRSVQLVIAAPPGEAPPDVLELPGEHRRLALRSDGLNPLADIALFLGYLRLFRRVRPAAYLSFTAKPNIYGALAAGLMRVPAIPNVSGLGTAFIRGGALQWLLSTLYRLAFRSAPRVLFQNEEDRALFIERGLVRAEQAWLVPGSGVDLQRFTPSPTPSEPGRAATFLYVGRLLGDKGVREFVDAAQQVRQAHPGVRFQLLGPTGAANRSAIPDHEVERWLGEGVVEYLGAVSDVRPHLVGADAVVLPSYREGLPRSLLEAAATARPLIATDVPGNRQLVVDGVNGLLCAARSAESLAEACERFLRLPPAERQAMGKAGRRMVEERFSEKKVIATYLDALAEVMDLPHVEQDH